MKYQSELFNEIIEVRGHEKSSLHYESECNEPWIEEAKGAYPKLCDYEGEWLNYMVENPIGRFPYETITANPTATVSNVVPYGYKSAILSGQTLVNVRKTISMNAGDLPEIRLDTSLMKANTKYSVFVTGVPSDRKWAIVPYVSYTNNQNATFVTSGNLETQLKFYINLGNVMSVEEIERVNITIVEGDFPLTTHFEGIQSVKMPVLTTTGKNLFKTLKNEGYYEYNNGVVDNNGQWVTDVNFKCLSSKILPNTTYTQSAKVTYKANVLTFWKDGEFTGKGIRGTITTFTTPSNCDEIRASCPMNHDLQLELGEKATTYEPYKSNILTVNEDVTLRSNGDICDELNLLTGQLTQRIGEDGVVLSQEVVKTVELTVTNQNDETLSKIKPIEGTMHIESSGTSINPTAVLEVPVEAITQNLNSFIEEE